ncbi:hypothetical protein BOX15_Mlig014178g1, partial [Macrostomum lignano]
REGLLKQKSEIKGSKRKLTNLPCASGSNFLRSIQTIFPTKVRSVLLHLRDKQERMLTLKLFRLVMAVQCCLLLGALIGCCDAREDDNDELSFVERRGAYYGLLGKRGPYHRLLGKRAGYRGLLGKRAGFRGLLGKRAGYRGLLGKRAGYRGLLGKRAGYRGLLGKRAGFRGLLGKRAGFRGLLGKRAGYRGLLGKKRVYQRLLGKRDGSPSHGAALQE